MIWAVLIIIGLIALVVFLPLIIYHFLVFPNINGVAQDLEWYLYDNESEHFLYWFGFWMIVLFGAFYGGSKVASSAKKSN